MVVVSMVVDSVAAVTLTGLLVMAADLLDVGTTADTMVVMEDGVALTADGAASMEQAAVASTARSGVPTRHIMVVFGEVR